jgi:citrate/tricarballylate utilization protein
VRLRELMSDAERQLRICNACRYCEGYCGVWHAIEWRADFDEKDVAYLSNLCHDCQDCYHACPYTEPHEYAINPPKIFSAIRNELYLEYARPRTLARVLYGRWNTFIAWVVGCVIFALVALQSNGSLFERFVGTGAFYRYVPESVMVSVFMILSLFILVTWFTASRNFWVSTSKGHVGPVTWSDVRDALRMAASLRFLGGGDESCADSTSSKLRKWAHQFLVCGFLLDFVSTTWAAFDSHVLGVQAPYPWTSPVVILGTLGGLGIVLGGAGLLYARGRAGEVAADASAAAMSTSFTLMLIIVAVTGLLLLILRDTSVMGVMLAVHLGSVAALYITAPYSKFVHFLFRFLALVRYAQEARQNK